jgi:hypothetical protein
VLDQLLCAARFNIQDQVFPLPQHLFLTPFYPAFDHPGNHNFSRVNPHFFFNPHSAISNPQLGRLAAHPPERAPRHPKDEGLSP